MTIRHTHIVGAGIAGLSAALAITRLGGRVTLYDSAPQPGGRCRTIEAPDGFAHDNGTHVLFPGNRNALRFLAEIGARSGWMEPEPEGIPIHDLRTQTTHFVGLQPWSWGDASRRPAGLGKSDLLRLVRLAVSPSDRPVGDLFAGSEALDSLIEPLTVAVLNTPVAEASSRRLGRAVRRLALPGAGRILIARDGLGAALVEPAILTLKSRDASFRGSQRLRSLAIENDRAVHLVMADATIPIQDDERVVLALPPYEIGRLLPELAVPTRFRPILNVHYRLPGLARPRMIGFLGGLAQWVVIRSDHVSVTVSAAGCHIDRTVDDLSRHIWGEIAPILRTFGLDAEATTRPDYRVVKEKRATISQVAGPLPQPPLRPLSNLALAGDWIGTLPATIESAVIAGERAARALQGARWRAAFPFRNPLKFEGITSPRS